jgi:8-oxo-dGTP pyrophosphatase MutT (NUDIX family)
VGPRRVGLASTAPLLFPDHPPPDRGHGGVGKGDDVEVVDHQHGVGQQPRGAHRLGVDRGRIDRDEPDPGPELRAPLLQPVHHAGAGPPFDLAEQALGAGEVDEAGVPPSVCTYYPARLTSKSRCTSGDGRYTPCVIEKLREVQVFENRFVQVFNDEVRFPDGTNGTYLRIDPPVSGGPGVVVLAVDGQAVGLVHSYRYPIGEEQWALPRGFGDARDDGDPLRTARREMSEELGSTADNLELLGWVTPDSGLQSARVGIVFAEVQRRGVPSDTFEIEAARWIDLPDLWSLVRNGEIEDSFTLSALARAASSGRIAGPA